MAPPEPDDDWAAPLARGPVDAVVSLPGSKSVTNRALVLASLAEGTASVRGALRSRDTRLMAGGLRALGIAIDDTVDGWRVSGRGGALRATADRVDVGNAGTVARFLPPVAALADRAVTFDGDPRMRRRPLLPLLVALVELGAGIDSTDGCLPVTVRGRGALRGGSVRLDASSSSQLVSGLLLVGPRCTEGIDIRHVGARLPSRPHIAMTVDMLVSAGADVDVDAERWRVAPGSLRSRDWDVEPDLSGAAPFLAAAAATAGTVLVPRWPTQSMQPGAALPGYLEAMGARCVIDDEGLRVTGPDRLVGLDADLGDASELVPVLAALGAIASTPTTLRGIAHMRGHETDRLAALAHELAARGASVDELADGLVIRPGTLRGGRFETYDDHRLVMAAAVLALVVDGLVVGGLATVGKTMPDFADRWLAMLG